MKCSLSSVRILALTGIQESSVEKRHNVEHSFTDVRRGDEGGISDGRCTV